MNPFRDPLAGIIRARFCFALLAAAGVWSAGISSAHGDGVTPEVAAPAVSKTSAAPAATPVLPPAEAKPAPVVAGFSTPLDDASLKALTPGEARTLLRIISLPPEKLVSLRDSVDALAKMSQEEKQVLRKKLENQRGGNGGTPPSPPPHRPRENLLARHWRSLPPEIRQQEQARFQKMSQEERRAYVAEIFRKSSRRPPAQPPASPTPPGAPATPPPPPTAETPKP